VTVKRGRLLNVTDCCVHVTHRCHNRQFLLRFGHDRRRYVARLREVSSRFAVDVLDYVVTSNHVHLLLWAPRLETVSVAMQFLQGVSARDYNRRKGRQGAYWSDRYRPTLIQNGAHLSRCLFYIGMNMVRARAVEHPQKWAACGYHELTGQRQRYRLVNRRRLLQCLGLPERLADFQQWYQGTMQDLCASGYQAREPVWTEAAAVGSREWVEELSQAVLVGKKSVEPVAASRIDPAVGEMEASYALNLSRRQSDALLQAATTHRHRMLIMATKTTPKANIPPL
jgi:putative transposase